jgi:hypothetical protein
MSGRALVLLALGAAAAGLVAPAPTSAGPSVDIRLRFGDVYREDPWVWDFVDYYHASPVVVERYYGYGIPAEDLSVALFLASHSRYDVGVILDWRRSGLGWYQITRRCRVSPAVFYTPLPPRGRAYGVYSRPYGHWQRHRHANYRFSDREAVELVNLRYATSRYGHDPVWFMKERSRGTSFRHIYGSDRRDGRRGERDWRGDDRNRRDDRDWRDDGNRRRGNDQDDRGRKNGRGRGRGNGR